MLSHFKFNTLHHGDLWGGLAAMLVAFPAAVAFGVTVYAPLGPQFAAQGALAGIIGVIVLGILAALLGGTDRLVTTPCAPAAAVLSAFALQMAQQGQAPLQIMTLLLLVGILAGAMQAGLGILGVGSLIKYIPYPVVSGYLTAVGLIIIGSQIPKLLGSQISGNLWQSLTTPNMWEYRAIAIGLITASVTHYSPRLLRRLPGIITGLLAGLLAYGFFALTDPALRSLEANPLIIGSLDIADNASLSAVQERWSSVMQTQAVQWMTAIWTAVTLAALLSIDTLKTCVILDRLTQSRHAPNRELFAQGIANTVANLMGGMSGAGQMGATLIGLNSGAQTRMTGLIEGVFSLLAALLLSAFIAWIPVSTLAGILIIIGLRMIDLEPLEFAKARSTRLDFFVVLAVVIVALTTGLIAASAIGVALAMTLFVRAQINGSVVRHKLELSDISSSWHRPQAELDILAKNGHQAVVFALQGNLFFGNTYQLYTDLEHEIATRAYVIIDFKRVQSIDITAAQLFKQIRNAIKERGATLVLCGMDGPKRDGQSIGDLLDQTRVWHAQSRTVRRLPTLDSAIAWVEDRLIGESVYDLDDQVPMPLQDMALFSRHKDETLSDLMDSMTIQSFNAGETIYERGSPGNSIFFVRRGTVRLVTRTGKEQQMTPVASFSRGDLFGGLAFLDEQPRPNDAIAATPTELYVLDRERFSHIAGENKKLANNLAMAMARTLAMRLRRTEHNLAMLQEY